MTEWEGKFAWHGPKCSCGSRATRRVGYLRRKCSACNETVHLRVDAMRGLVAMTAAEVHKWDERGATT